MRCGGASQGDGQLVVLLEPSDFSLRSRGSLAASSAYPLPYTSARVIFPKTTSSKKVKSWQNIMFKMDLPPYGYQCDESAAPTYFPAQPYILDNFKQPGNHQGYYNMHYQQYNDDPFFNHNTK